MQLQFTMISVVLISNNKRLTTAYLEGEKKNRNNIIFRIKPEKTEFTIGQIKEIIREVKVYQPKKRIYVLEDFYMSSLEAQNAFLKLLEEPPENTRFIMVVGNTHQVVPTIISRSKIISLEKQTTHDLSQPVKKSLMNLVTNNLKYIISDGSFLVGSKEEAVGLLNDIVFFFRVRLVSDKCASLIIRETIRIKLLLENNNLNPQLSVDHLLIFIRKAYTMK